MSTYTAYIEYDPETELYVGTVPSISGAHTQGATLDKLRENLEEVVGLCIEELKDNDLLEEPPRFVGLQQIEVSV